MWKPSETSRRWNRIHARKSDERRRESKRKLKGRRRLDSWRDAGDKSSEAGGVEVPTWRRPGVSRIECPEDFSLESNFDEVVGVVQRIRSQSGRRNSDGIYIDFRPIRRLSVTAALILAAELDRWNQVKRRSRLKAVDVGNWDSSVRVLLRDMGFFGLLQIEGDAVDLPDGESDIRYLKFRSGRYAEGEAIARLQAEDLEPIFGELPRKQYLYAAVTEAMTNVVQHAYEPSRRYPRWWLAGGWNARTSQVAIVIYDRGMGIPRTLPRRVSDRLYGAIPCSP